MVRTLWVRVVLALGLGVACVGCAETEESARAESELRSELSRAIEPPMAVGSDLDIGTSIDALAESAAQGGHATYSPTMADCVMDHYEHDGIIVAVYERCPGSYRRLFVFHVTDDGGVELWRVFGDLDDDAYVDAWFDPDRGGLLIEDRNFDAAVDASSESFGRLGPDYSIEGFDAGWIPPAYPEERILEDTDFDGRYDLETVTAGKGPDGNASYWQKP